MDKAFNLGPWQNKPSVETPLGKTRLNQLNNSVDTIDNRVISLYNTKANKTELLSLFTDIAWDTGTGIITFTRVDGSTFVLDTQLEKLAVNFAYDAENERLVIVLDDGTEQYVDMSALVTIYEFLDSDTIIFHVQSDGKVSATIRAGSITAEMLDPDYLAEILVQVGYAEGHARSAENSAILAERWAVGRKAEYPESATDNAKYYAEQAQAAAELAKGTVNLNLPEFWIDFDTGCLMATFEKPFNFYIDENGDLICEIS